MGFKLATKVCLGGRSFGESARLGRPGTRHLLESKGKLEGNPDGNTAEGPHHNTAQFRAPAAALVWKS